MFGFMRNGIICIAALTFLKAGLGQVVSNLKLHLLKVINFEFCVRIFVVIAY